MLKVRQLESTAETSRKGKGPSHDMQGVLSFSEWKMETAVKSPLGYVLFPSLLRQVYPEMEH